MKTLIVETDTKSYPIVYHNTFSHLVELLNQFNSPISKIVIITDDNVGPLYAKQVESILKEKFSEVHTTTFENGEINKNLSTISQLYAFLIKHQIDRKSMIIALGGGVVGDMAGYVAATYMRGIRFIQIPTTLLSQVDSSVGGKTGVDFNGYKNIVGAFYQPELVYINTETLKTLPKRQFNSGMAEVIKHGLILDKDYLEQIEAESAQIQDLEPNTIADIIYTSCKIKSKIVSEDEKETGRRALLNFGHTIGHAIERLKNFELLHGECIAIGFIAALHISEQMGYMDVEDIERVIKLLEKFDLPTSVQDISVSDIYEEMFHDKKTEGNQVNFILLSEIGCAFINKSTQKKQIIQALEKVVLI